MTTYNFTYAETDMSLTTDRAESSYNVPVLIVGGNAYGKNDLMPEGKGELGWLAAMETAEMAITVYARNLREAGEAVPEIVSAFLA